jgi:hypothetical protein
LILAALVLAYIIYDFQSDSSDFFNCFGETKLTEELEISPVRATANAQILSLQQQLKEAEKRQQEAQRDRLEAAQHLSAIMRRATMPSVLTNPLSSKMSEI